MSERTMLLGDGQRDSAGRTRRLRRVFIWCSAVVCIGFVAVWLFGPGLLELIVRHRLIEMAESSVGGTAQVERVQLSWTGPQRVEQLRTSGDGCRIELDLNATIHASLWTLAGAPDEPLRVACSGGVRVLGMPEPPSVGVSSGSMANQVDQGPLSLSGLPPLNLEIGPLSVEIDDSKVGKRQLSTDNLLMVVEPDSGVLQISGDVHQQCDGVAGEVHLDVDLAHMVDGHGRLHVERVTGSVSIEAVNPCLPLEQLSGLRSLSMTGVRQRRDGPATLTVEGALAAASGSDHPFTLSLERAGDKADSPGQLELQTADFPTAALDEMAKMQGQLEALLGAAIDLRIVRDERPDSSVTWHGEASAPGSTLVGAVQTSGDRIWMDQQQRLTGSIRVTPECIAKVLWRLGPVLQDLHTVEDPIELMIEELSLDRTHPTSSLNANARIVIGAVTLDARAPIFSILEDVLGTARRYVPAVIDPIEISIVDGVLTYVPFEIHFKRAKVEIAGLVDLNDGRLDMTMQLPIDAIGHSVKELRGVSQLIGGEVQITGTVHDPIVQFVPVFRPEGLFRTPGFGDLLESIGQEDQQQLLEGIGDLLRKDRD